MSSLFSQYTCSCSRDWGCRATFVMVVFLGKAVMPMVIKKVLLSVLLFFVTSCSSIVVGQSDEERIESIRDSLDGISLEVPVFNTLKAEVTLHISSQEQWNLMAQTINGLLKKGKKSINVIVDAKQLVFGEKIQDLSNLDYPEANVRIHAKRTKMIPAGPSFIIDISNIKGSFYVNEYSGFDRNDVLFDNKMKPLTLYGPTFSIDSPIEEVVSYGTEDILNKDGTLYKRIYKVWRFKIDLPDLNEEDCKLFQILLTRNWTSMRHQVVKVEKGYLYFNLRSDEAPTLMQMVMEPNVDTKSHKTYPRCRFFNCPVSEGIHVKGDNIYIPKNQKALTIGKGGRLLTVNDTKLNTFEISGFDVIGAGNSACVSISRSVFNGQMWVRDNRFSNLSSSAVIVNNSENICIFNNTINHTRGNALLCIGRRITVWGNKLKDIGFMYQTMAIGFDGTDIHIQENTIEDFCYSAIAGGGLDDTKEQTFIIERNLIKHSYTFVERYKERTVADGGGIYIGPQNTMGIIRNNVIQNITGIGSNRGIFLDDGCKNLSIYGNLIIGTANSYDIDLRYCTTYERDIPDHNTRNIIIQNIMSGYYRFEEGDNNASCVVGGNVLLTESNHAKNRLAVANKYKDDSDIRNRRVDKFVKQYIPRSNNRQDVRFGSQ